MGSSWVFQKKFMDLHLHGLPWSHPLDLPKSLPRRDLASPPLPENPNDSCGNLRSQRIVSVLKRSWKARMMQKKCSKKVALEMHLNGNKPKICELIELDLKELRSEPLTLKLGRAGLTAAKTCRGRRPGESLGRKGNPKWVAGLFLSNLGAKRFRTWSYGSKGGWRKIMAIHGEVPPCPTLHKALSLAVAGPRAPKPREFPGAACCTHFFHSDLHCCTWYCLLFWHKICGLHRTRIFSGNMSCDVMFCDWRLLASPRKNGPFVPQPTHPVQRWSCCWLPQTEPLPESNDEIGKTKLRSINGGSTAQTKSRWN